MTEQTRKLIIGNKSDVRAFLKSITRFYVYVLRRSDGMPFYVGKGKGGRVFQHEAEAVRHEARFNTNPYKANVIRKHERLGLKLIYEIDSLHRDEDAAYVREAQLIEGIGRLHEGGPLTNLAPGGGTSTGAAPLSKERHRQSLSGIPENDPERATINRFLLSIGEPKSICVKVLGRSTKPIITKPFSHATRKPTQRQAFALVAAAAANGIELVDGCVIPRSFTYEGIDAFVENGVSCDIVTSGMASLVSSEQPLDEAFQLNVSQIRILQRFVTEEKLQAFGIL